MPWSSLKEFDKATKGAFLTKYSLRARRAAMKAANEYLRKHGDSKEAVSSAIAIAHTVAKKVMAARKRSHNA